MKRQVSKAAPIDDKLVPTMIRLPKDVRDTLERHAKSADRTVSKMGAIFLQKGIEVSAVAN